MNPAEIRNTPGYFYAMAYWLAVFIIYWGSNKKNKDKKKWIISGAVLIIIVWFMTITKGVTKGWFLGSLFVVYLILFFYIRMFFHCSWIEAAYFCAEAVMTGEFMASLCWQICYYIALHFTGRLTHLLESMCMLVVYAMVMAAAWFFIRLYLGEQSEARIGPRDVLVVTFAVLSIDIVSNLSYIESDTLFSTRNIWETFLVRTLVDTTGIILIIALRFQARELQLRLERDTLHNIKEMQYKTYQLSKESIDMINQKYHDLKHQIILLKEEANSQKSLEYLDQMEREIKIYEAQNKTGNHVLDTVLTAKSTHCQARGIELKVIADGKQLNFMNDMEISSLFGNMLDNAIENVEKQKDHSKRLIRLYISQEKGFVRIRMENYCEEKVKFRNGMPMTTKKDRYLHGYGMKSIQKTVHKYNGSVVASQENNWFMLRILIPQQE